MRAALCQAVLLLVLALVPAAIAWQRLPPEKFLRPTGDDGDTADQVTLAQVAAWQPAPLWIDARTAAEHASGHVPGSILLNEDTWEALLPGFIMAWTPGQRIVVYCSASCAASRRVAVRLRLAGASEVSVLKGGWEGWRSAHPEAAAR